MNSSLQCLTAKQKRPARERQAFEQSSVKDD